MCAFGDVPEKRTAQKALLSGSTTLTAIDDGLNTPVCVGTRAELLHMASSLLELCRTCACDIDRLPRKPILSACSGGHVAPHQVATPRSHAAPDSSLATFSSTTPRLPAGFPATPPKALPDSQRQFFVAVVEQIIPRAPPRVDGEPHRHDHKSAREPLR